MTYAPVALRVLADYWVSKNGINLGIVGDTAHALRGVSYHLGESQLTSDAYSRQTARDRAGLTDAASALDLGKLRGSYGDLRAFSKWLVTQARGNAPGTSDMREIIYSPDGQKVLRWDRERGYSSAPREGEADSSHLWHTHISWYRDAEERDHTLAFRPYFKEETLVAFTADPNEQAGTYEVVVDSQGIPYNATPGERVDIPAGLRRPMLGPVYVTALQGRSHMIMFLGERTVLVPTVNVSLVPVDIQPEIDAAIAADRAKARVTWG